MAVNSQKSDKSWTQERRKELDALIDFSNAEIQSMDDRDLADLVYNCRLFEEDQAWQSFMFRGTSREPDPQDLIRKKEALLELQGHLKEKLETILWTIKAGGQTPILEITGTMVFTAHPSKDRFLLDLKQGDDREVDPLKKKKARLDLRLMDLIRVLGLNPRRFKRCLKCEQIFYQPSFKEKVYCSPKCSGAHRQEEFQKRKLSPGHRDLKEENVIEDREEAIDELKNS